MIPRATAILAALVATLALAPGIARADGDPASDVLLGENVFYPYTPPVSASLQKALNAETAAAARAHSPVKVALIASPVDLGVIPALFGKPQKYADFLDQEISYLVKQPLLVVMAAGYGVQGMKPAARAAVSSLAPPPGRTSNDLARAAMTAVRRLASASGHPIAVPSAATGGGGSAPVVLAAGLAVAAVAGAAAVVTVRRRRAGAR